MSSRTMSDAAMRALIDRVATYAVEYLAGLGERPVAPDAAALTALQALDAPLPASGEDPDAVLDMLARVAGPATVASAGPRYFGFVTGGSLPAALAAGMLATAWDQNATLEVMSPAAAALERTAAHWVLQALGLPEGAAVGFTTGATMANFTALAAARHAVLGRAGWNVEEEGLAGAPAVSVVVGDEVHVSLLKALALLGLGRSRVLRVPTDAQGRMRVGALPAVRAPAIVCLQAGNVNTGAFDPARAIVARAREHGAWVHVDGAFGLWALASPAHAHLADGVVLADSWATDAHKWLNVPYDSGLAIVREPEPLRAAMAATAAYLVHNQQGEACERVPEMSRRARGVEAWAALRSLGRDGLADLIERCCNHARRFAEGLRTAGAEILADVVLNQVLAAFGDDERTRRVIAALQAEGTCWCGGTVWHGRAAMRISVSSWATTEEDVQRSIEAIVRVAGEVPHP